MPGRSLTGHGKPSGERHEKILLALDIAIIALGIGCIADPDLYYQGFPMILGILMLLWGALLVDHSLQTREYMNHETQLMSTGIIILVIAAVIMTRGENSYGLIGASWGIYGLLHAIENLNQAIYLATTRQKTLRLPVSIFMTLFGGTLAILLLMDPVKNVYGHMIFIGLEFLYMGLENGARRIVRIFRKHRKQQKKQEEEEK